MIVHVTTVDVLRAHAPSKMVQMPAALANLANISDLICNTCT